MSNIYKPLAVVALEAAAETLAAKPDAFPTSAGRNVLQVADKYLAWLKENVPDDERPWAP